MIKIGQFVYSWGNGHYSRMSALADELEKIIPGCQMHYFSRDDIYQKLLERYGAKHVHQILMPVPVDGKCGPSIFLSLLNLAVPVRGSPPLVYQVKNYLKKEAEFFDSIKFDLVISDGDVGPNVLAHKRAVNSIFVTNQFAPKLWPSRFYLYGGVRFIARQIAKATKIVVADSPPPYTICHYNLNFPEKLKDKVIYAGHFATKKKFDGPKTELEHLVDSGQFGYWMRTGNKSTNQATGQKYEQVFRSPQMQNQKRIVSHANPDPSIDRVIGKDGKTYSISEAFEKKVDWLQIDIGFLTEQQKDTVLEKCTYAVINGSHTVMGEILGIKGKPIIGIPVYDEQSNNIRWAQENGLGIEASTVKQVASAVLQIEQNYSEFEAAIRNFQQNFVSGGARQTAQVASQLIQTKR